VVPSARGEADHAAPDLRTSLRVSVGRPYLRALLLTGLAGGIGTSVLVYNQVPAMADAGLALGVATGLAGARGLLQLGGRIPLPWVIARVGTRRSLRGAHFLTGVSCLVLIGAGTVPVAVAFAVTAGLAIGALAALESIYAAEVVDARTVGLALGMYSLMRGIGAALGPTVGGALTTAVGARWPALVLAAAAGILAAFVVPTVRPERLLRDD
jgi:MFS family permease